MISYEELCTALERYARERGPLGSPAKTAAAPATHAFPPDLIATDPHVAAFGTEDHTSVSTAMPADDASEVEMHDVLSDEESTHE